MKLWYIKNAVRKIYFNLRYSLNSRLPHQSAREKMRRVRQGKAGTCYVHGAQYRD